MVWCPGGRTWESVWGCTLKVNTSEHKKKLVGSVVGGMAVGRVRRWGGGVGGQLLTKSLPLMTSCDEILHFLSLHRVYRTCCPLSLTRRSMARFLLVLALLRASAALQLAARVPPRAVMAMAEPTSCAMISLSSEDPLRLAKILKKAWMEGGVKRGLVGSVLLGEDGVKIAALGQVARLQSFANWIEENSALVTNVDMVDAPEVPTDSFTSKFNLADAESWSGGVTGSFSGELAEQLKALGAEMDIEKERGVTQSNDEGLF